MEINLSVETITTVYNSLRSSKQNLKGQLEMSMLNEKRNHNITDILVHQLNEVEDALAVFEELMDCL